MDNILPKKSMGELKMACSGVVEYLKNKHPYCTVVISQDEIKLVETTIGIPLNSTDSVEICKDTKEILCKQLELLAKESKICVGQRLIDYSKAIALISRLLLDI